MAPVATFPLRAVAALFIERQHLDRPRGQTLSTASLEQFTADVGGVQLDSINVIDRAHHLTLWSRFGPFDREDLARLLYDERVLFEYWSHAACLVPRSHFRWWRRAMLDYRVRHTGWASWLRKHAKMRSAVEEAIRERGPLGNAAFKQARPGGQSGWWSWKPATHALHHLWMTGRLSIHSRQHFHKRFELTERIFPEIASVEVPTADDFQRWHVERGLHAMGAATELDLRSYLTFPRSPRGVRRRALDALRKSGAVVDIAVEGSRAPWFVLARDLPDLERAAARERAPEGSTLLAPFDSFLWYRERTERLFGFEYRIEVYTPGHKRVHGYYTLPFYHDGQLIARVDAKNHREERRLEVRNVHFEPWFVAGKLPPAAAWGALDRERALAGLATTLDSLATFLGAERVSIARVTPTKLATPLRAALRESVTAVVAP